MRRRIVARAAVTSAVVATMILGSAANALACGGLIAPNGTIRLPAPNTTRGTRDEVKAEVEAEVAAVSIAAVGDSVGSTGVAVNGVAVGTGTDNGAPQPISSAANSTRTSRMGQRLDIAKLDLEVGL